MEITVLDFRTAVKHIESPCNRKDIEHAINHEYRVRMHTETIVTKDDYTRAHKDFLSWVGSILIEPKFERFKELFSVPLPTNDIADSIFDELKRCLNANNKFIAHDFEDSKSEELNKDFEEFLAKTDLEDFFYKEGINTLKKYFNSFVVCDMPQLSEGFEPYNNPYFNLLKIDDVVDVDCEEDGSVNYIIFEQELTEDEEQTFECKYAIFDQMTQSVIGKLKNVSNSNSIEGKYVYIIEPILHNITIDDKPFCPAFKFWSTLLSEENCIDSQNPISNQLGKLDKYLFSYVSDEYAELYAKYSIYWGYKQKCDYVEEIHDQIISCQNGFISWAEGAEMQMKHKRCPKCSKSQLLSAGSFIEVDPPEVTGDTDLREPLGIIKADIDALEFGLKTLKEKEYDIRYNSCGVVPNQSTTKVAINEDQVQSQFETRQNILMKVKGNFEMTMWRLYNVLGRMRYGELYKGSTVDLGSEFFLQSTEKVNKDYDDSRKAGRPAFELLFKRNMMYSTQFYNNPMQLQLATIFQNIEPYQDYDIKQLKDLGIDLSDPINFTIKLNFVSFVSKFERDFGSILTFMSQAPFNKKIDVINAQLKQYANDRISESTSARQTQSGAVQVP